MKKIFLLFGIAVSISATAQQKDLFDIGKHIQKNLQEKNKPTGTNKMLNTFGRIHPVTGNYFSNKPSSTFTLPNGDKVVSLLFDNMPCIVPDMKQFQLMPNPGKDVFSFNLNYFTNKTPGAIPNGAQPLGIIVDGKPGY